MKIEVFPDADGVAQKGAEIIAPLMSDGCRAD